MRHVIQTATARIIKPEAICRYGSLASTFTWAPRAIPAKATSQTIAEWEIVAARPRSAACATVPRTATIKAAIIVFE